MAFCLPPDLANKFKAALVDGTINPDQLTAMTSAERREFFGKIVGEDNAKDVNALLESKLLLKDQNAGLVTWAKQTAGITEPQRRDLISRIEKLDRVLNPTEERAFLADLAAQKIGATVTLDEAKAISEGAKKVTELKAAIPDGAAINSKERLAYGLAADDYHTYMNHLLGKDKDTLLSLAKEGKIGKLAVGLAGASKGLQSSMDLSALLRQGLKGLLTHPTKWAQAAKTMFEAIGNEIKGVDAMRLIRADALSRPNALNGKYRAGGYDVGVDFEENLPSHAPEKIPLFGKLYKISEAAYNGMLLRLRLDLADQTIAAGEKFGIDTLNPVQAEGLGKLVNALTGRGAIGGLTPEGSKAVNALFYSIRFLKSNYDTLTGHSFGYGIKDPMTRAFVRREAAKNLGKILMAEAGILGTAALLHPGSTSFDPRSTLFGKIKIGQTTFDVSAGMGALVTLASRIVPTIHNGEIGLWNESQDGKWTNLIAGKYGQQNGMDVLLNFFEGRLSPVAGVIRDLLKGENYQGQKPTVLNEGLNLVTPMNWQTVQQSMSEPNIAAAVGSVIADAAGINTNAPNPVDSHLPTRDPTELELVRLGFNSKNIQPQSGDTHIDSLIEEHLHPLLEERLKTYMAAPFYQKLTDARKALYLKGLIEGTIRYAKSLAARDQDNRKDFQEFRKQNIPARKAAVINEMNQGAQP